ncbi:class I SAM-dependent methyltransferase [Streptomyces sp. NPDC013181]|uniref:class I SAM-dependent methyltransferase n=1 Tax=unclassified Streptomyces TaxID=2593676 RepID=UPI0036CC9EE8
MHADGIAAVGGDISHLDPDQYFLPRGYTQRPAPEYFVDAEDDGVLWQPDVYPYAARIADETGSGTIIDLGCGRGGKLALLHAERPDRQYVGVDVGVNITWCQDNLPFGRWIEADLETSRALPLSAETVRDSVVVCSDVLEHLVRPEVATDLIAGLLRDGARAAVLSTPARELRAGAADPGPPRNTSHVREWASEEFCAFVRSRGLEITHFSHTRSDDSGGGLTTQLLLVRPGGGTEGGAE